MTDRPRLGVIFAGGGSGGHLFPGLAVAEQLRHQLPDTRVRFICSDRAIDRSILEAAAIDFTQSPAAPLSSRPAGLVRFLTRWPSAVRHTRQQIRDLGSTCDRVVLVAVGGFVAAPSAAAAPKTGPRHVPVAMLNLDAVPGKANRLIARRADRSLTTAELRGIPGTERWTQIPPIVRTAALAPADTAECNRRFGLDPDRPTLFITGASQGAGSINAFIEAFVDRHPATLRGWNVLHQAGASANIADLRAAYDRAGIPASVEPFIEEMGLAWGAAGAALARAAAGTVGEVIVNRVPTLFLPYPHHRDEHQRKNAEPLEAAGVALLARDHVHPESTLAEAGPLLERLLTNHAFRQDLTDRLEARSPQDPLAGAKAVAQSILELAAINGEPATPA